MNGSTDFPTRTQAAETRRNKGTGLRQTPQETQTKAEAQESAGGGGDAHPWASSWGCGPCWSRLTGQGRQEAVPAPETWSNGIQHRQGPGSDTKMREAASQPKASERVLCIGFKIELPRQLDAKVA